MPNDWHHGPHNAPLDETGRPVVRLPVDPPRPMNAPLVSPPRPGEPCPFHLGAVIGPDGRCPYSASTEPGVVCAFGDPPRTGPYVLREEGELATEQSITRDPGDVDHPPHYGGRDDPYEAIKVVEAWHLGFHLGNVVKYLRRAGRKPGADRLADLRKARWYLDRAITREEEQR